MNMKHPLPAKPILLILLTAMPFLQLIAQIPREVPGPNDPIDFTHLPNVLLYIGGPILMVIVFILWRRSKNKKQEDQED